MTTTIDDWLPKAHARIHHARTSTAAPDELWEAAQSVRIRDTPRLARLIRWRLGRHAPATETTFEEFFRTGIFMLLEEGERLHVSGVAGRIWAPSGEYARFETAADYRQYDKPGTAKVVLRNAVRPHASGSEIFHEAGVWVADRRALMIFRPFWALVGPLSGVIGTEALTAAVRRAEGR